MSDQKTRIRDRNIAGYHPLLQPAMQWARRLAVWPAMLCVFGPPVIAQPKDTATSGSANIPAGRSQWVYRDGDGQLQYKTTDKGDRIMDFSYAGYQGGGVQLPAPPVTIQLQPVDGDNSQKIQAAIDHVAALPVKNGFRGVVLLAPGSYDCTQPLSITTSGVVLRGSGSGKEGSILRMTGRPHECIAVHGRLNVTTAGIVTALTDRYVPAGSRQIHVTDAAGWKPGDQIRLTKTVTPVWLAFMGMDHLERNGKPQTWLSGSITTDRVIDKVAGNSITLKVPLADNFDAAYLNPPGVTVAKVRYQGELSEIGIEHLRIEAHQQSGTITQQHDRAFTLSGVRDAWVRDVQVFNTVNSIGITGRRITLDHVDIYHELPTVGAAKPADINGSGTQLLLNRCIIKGDNVFYFATGARVTGPIVLLNCSFTGHGWIQPHQRWATGILVDGCKVPEGGIDFMNRGEYGSGHGWAVGWAVAWNSMAASYTNQMPPGSHNWVIGGRGRRVKMAMPFTKSPQVPEGIYDAHGRMVAPASLYLAQLKERLGAKALANIGY